MNADQHDSMEPTANDLAEDDARVEAERLQLSYLEAS